MAKERISNIPQINEPISSNTLTTIDFNDHEAVKRECMESLVAMIQNNKGDIRTLAVVRELLDRVIGKPVTPIISQVSIQDANKPAPTVSEVLRKWQFVQAIASNDPLLIDVTPHIDG